MRVKDFVLLRKQQGGKRAHKGRGASAPRHLCITFAAALLLQVATASPARAQAGSLDPSFGSGGKVTTSFACGPSGGLGVAIQHDGKIVAAGQAVSAPPLTSRSPATTTTAAWTALSAAVGK